MNFFRHEFAPRLIKRGGEGGEGVAVAVFIALYLLLAWNFRWAADDIHFFFRMAENAAEGRGFYYTPPSGGESAYGQANSNFLFSVLLIIPFLADANPYEFSAAIELAFLPATLLLFWQLSGAILPSLFWRWRALTLLSMNWTFFGLTTGGLGTPTTIFCATASLFLFWRFYRLRRRRDLLNLSLLFGLASLFRWDAGAFCLPLWGLCVLLILRGLKLSIGEKAIQFALLTIPAALFVLIAGGFKWIYYGSPLPLSYWHKAAVPGIPMLWYVQKGALFIYSFLESYWLIYLSPILIFGWMRARKLIAKESKMLIVAVVAMLAGWLLYLLRIGGGYIEFRFIAPMLPPLYLLIALALVGLSSKKIASLCAMIFIAASIGHGISYKEKNAIVPLPSLNDRPILPDEMEWIRFGRELNQLFGDYNSNVLVATTIGGAFAYYGKLFALEMHGWTDRGVIDNAYICTVHYDCDGKIGHLLYPRPDYLVSRGVNLVFGHLDFWEQRVLALPPRDALKIHISANAAKLTADRFFANAELKPDKFKDGIPLPAAAQLVAFRTDYRRIIYAVYLVRNSYLDDFFAANDILRIPLFPPGRNRLGVFVRAEN